MEPRLTRADDEPLWLSHPSLLTFVFFSTSGPSWLHNTHASKNNRKHCAGEFFARAGSEPCNASRKELGFGAATLTKKFVLIVGKFLRFFSPFNNTVHANLVEIYEKSFQDTDYDQTFS